MLFLAHEIPGRLRFVSPRLKADQRSTARLRSGLRAPPGVQEVAANRLAGSITVRHSGGRDTRDAIFVYLKGCDVGFSGLRSQVADDDRTPEPDVRTLG